MKNDSFLTSFLNYFNFIKFEHSVFALPFALSGAFLVKESGLPEIRTIFLIILAMVGARSFAMSINRIIDANGELCIVTTIKGRRINLNISIKGQYF